MLLFWVKKQLLKSKFLGELFEYFLNFLLPLIENCKTSYTNKIKLPPLFTTWVAPIREASVGERRCSYKPRFKVFAHLFQKAAQSRARSPCRCPQTANLLLSFKKGRRGELSCQSNSRGEPTRSEGFSFICAKILYTAQRAISSSASFLGTFPTGEG